MSAKSFHQDLFRTLIKSKMRFLSILAIIAIGVGFFAGIKATEPNMILSADHYYQQQQLSDFRLISPLGFRSEDIELVNSIEGILTVQPGYMLDLFLYSDAGNRFTVRVFSYDPADYVRDFYLNRPTLKSGRLPEKTGEIILEAGNNVPETISLGSQVVLEVPDHDENSNQLLTDLHYSVVGRVNSPLYINFERGQTSVGDGSIDFYAYICESAFKMERYSELYIRTVQSPDLTAYSEAYDSHLEPLEQKLIESGRAAIADETNQFRSELNEGIEAWLDNKVLVEQEFREALIVLDEAERQIEAGENTITELENAREAALETDKAEFDQQIEFVKMELEQARADLEAGRREFDTKKMMAYDKLDEAEKEIRESERQIYELPDEWFVLTRAQQPGYSDYGDDARRIGAVATVFPLFFFLVAALVCLTTMTRMVEEERVQIGTLKALGYNTFSISSKYIVYALAASLTGSVIGIAAGFQIFPKSIMNAYSLLYSIQERLTPFHIDLAVLSIFLAVTTTVTVTLLAALKVLKSSPAVLMQPRAPKPGKRVLLEYISPLWNRLTFMQKLTARNLFRYKLRFLMTVIGIAGCTALLLTGFGLKDSVNAIIGRQFDELFIYDGQLMINPERDEANQAFDDLLTEQDGVEAFMPVHSETITVQRYGTSTSFDATLLVPESADQVSAFYSIRQRESGQSLPLTPNGAVITEKLANLLNVGVGDSLTIRDVENRTYTLFISSLAENYVTHFIYMSPQYFEQLTYRQPIYNSAVFNLSDPEGFDQTSFQTELMEHEAVLGSMFTLTLADDFSRNLQSLDYVVIILIIAAGALAFVVLYNLTSINISERIREIATIKVLGFRDREVSDYVFRENLLLTMFGIIAGLLLGVLLHQSVMSTMETDAIMFGKEIHWLSFLISVLLTSFFSVIVNFFMFYRLRKIQLVESLKAAE